MLVYENLDIIEEVLEIRILISRQLSYKLNNENIANDPAITIPRLKRANA